MCAGWDSCQADESVCSFRKKRISPFCIRIFPYGRYIIITEFVETLCFPVKPVKPSSPVSDDLNNAPRPGLSKKAKFWIGLSLAVCIPLIAAVLLWLAYLALFPNNPRLVVNSVRLAGNSGYWSPADPDERQARMDYILSILRIRPGGTPMFSGKKEYDLAAMAAKLRTEIPELERADVRRVLPDQLIFELHERIPVANLGANFYIDDTATVLDKSSYYDVSGSLPALSCKPSAVRASHEADPFKRGEVLNDSSIRTVLDFLRLTRLEFTDVHPKLVYISQDFIQFDLLYRNDPDAFSVLIPLRVREEQLRDDIFGRLLPKLESSVRNHEAERSLDLRFKDRIIAKKRG